ncbi:hypothetical protein CPHLJ_1g1880 [Cryptosporidium parvum]|uniref:Uncharacterized protein n=1 Tax=Cryptosporidium parvum TaxID=5807 RepID=A0A7S7LJH5_CRYPV|nr:Uncharacterized protein CPATCC_0037470 [Cryptosporidium parvum]WKS76088.1 hypothetical protein CPCDC_1g1880 [Cryptosporidium sp. 43IA8]WRK30580.1 Uncharacterized protein cpbgf_1001870 [Cryptosporidium parvum]|eukprot:QOY43440.1 hypothetical protein CPATCC_000226 [Cryptosporidium parvum]
MKNLNSCIDENGKTPHFYYQRSVILEQELKELKLKYIKIQNESNRNKEILQNQIEKLVAINRKQESLLFEFEQYRQICRTGIAIICRFCGSIIENEAVMQHLVDIHLFESIENKSSSLESNQIFLMNQLEIENKFDSIGSKCFELITQDANEVDKIDIDISMPNKNNILIKITGFNEDKDDMLICSTDSLFKLRIQISKLFPEIPLPKIVYNDISNIHRFLKYILNIKNLRESSIIRSFLNI